MYKTRPSILTGRTKGRIGFWGQSWVIVLGFVLLAITCIAFYSYMAGDTGREQIEPHTTQSFTYADEWVKLVVDKGYIVIVRGNVVEVSNTCTKGVLTTSAFVQTSYFCGSSKHRASLVTQEIPNAFLITVSSQDSPVYVSRPDR